MTREAFLRTYRELLFATCPWAQDLAHLDRFMTSVENTVAGRANSWYHDSPNVHTAWRKCGGTGRASLRRLRALPTEGSIESGSQTGGAGAD